MTQARTPNHSSSEDVPLKQTGEFGKLVTMDHKISWEKHLEEQLFPLGRQKFLSWECAYYHKEAQLLLNAYVDDLKMVGKKESIAPMWKKIRSKADLDPETALEDGVYLGCAQRDSKPSKEVVRAKQELFAKLMSNQPEGSDPEAGGG